VSARRTRRTAVLALAVGVLAGGVVGAPGATARVPEPYEHAVDVGTPGSVPSAPFPYLVEAPHPASVDVEPTVTATISDPAPLRRDEVTVTGGGFPPGERVTASLPSRNRGELGAAVADPEGSVTIGFEVPAALPEGDQEVLLTGTSGAQAGTGFALRPLLQDLLVRLVRWWELS
jgi:hypothetical protein